MSKFGRMYRRAVKRAGVKKLGRKVYKATGLVNPIKKGKLSSTRLMKDVAMLKSMINAEKKRLITNPTVNTLSIGQVNGNSSGHFLLDCTPLPAQGTGYNQRSGNSIKWHSSHYKFQFYQFSNTVSRIRLKIQFVKVIGTPLATVSNVMGQFILNNSFITGATIYDYFSERNPDYYKNFAIVKTKYVTVEPDQLSSQQVQKVVDIGFRLRNHHVKWATDNTTLSAGQIFLLITADSGNSNAVTANTTTGVYVQGVLTGLGMNYIRTDYFYDN